MVNKLQRWKHQNIFRNRAKPSAAESRPPQSGDDCRATAHDVPKQAGPVVLDHQNNRPLIDSEVIWRHPPTSRAMRDSKRLVERWLEPIFTLHPQFHFPRLPHGRDDNLRSKRKRGDDNPRRDGTVVGAERGASSGIVEKLAFDAIDHTLRPTGPIACCKSPTMFAVAGKVHGIVNRVFLLHKRALPAILEVVAAALPHEFVANTAKVDPHMRKLVREERP